MVKRNLNFDDGRKAAGGLTSPEKIVSKSPRKNVSVTTPSKVSYDQSEHCQYLLTNRNTAYFLYSGSEVQHDQGKDDAWQEAQGPVS